VGVALLAGLQFRGRRGGRTLGAPSAYPSTAGRDAGFVLEARGITADEAASALAAAQALVGLSIREPAAQTSRQLAQRWRPPRDVAAASAVGTSPYSYRGRACGGGPPCVSDPKRIGYAAGQARRAESPAQPRAPRRENFAFAPVSLLWRFAHCWSLTATPGIRRTPSCASGPSCQSRLAETEEPAP
jgi:hypothetical protein